MNQCKYQKRDLQSRQIISTPVIYSDIEVNMHMLYKQFALKLKILRTFS